MVQLNEQLAGKDEEKVKPEAGMGAGFEAEKPNKSKSTGERARKPLSAKPGYTDHSQEKSTKFCRYCGETIPRASKYCVQCGEQLQFPLDREIDPKAKCPACGAEIPYPTAKFCVKCGAKLSSSLSTEAKMDQL